jgi:hypothetical protein
MGDDRVFAWRKLHTEIKNKLTLVWGECRNNEVRATGLRMSVLDFQPENFIVLAVSNTHTNIDRQAIRREPLLMPL